MSQEHYDIAWTAVDVLVGIVALGFMGAVLIELHRRRTLVGLVVATLGIVILRSAIRFAA